MNSALTTGDWRAKATAPTATAAAAATGRSENGVDMEGGIIQRGHCLLPIGYCIGDWAIGSLRNVLRGNANVNTAEGFFSLLKRGINGTFHHVSKGHLHRYCAEFEFRYNSRIARALQGPCMASRPA